MVKEISKPVLFMVFNRPEKTKKVWEQIQKAKPKKLYISADAPRAHLPEDRQKCEKVREIVSHVDWDCNVKYLLHDKNLGCTLAGKTAFDWVFSQEEEMIQLEDDVLPTQSFFGLCKKCWINIKIIIEFVMYALKIMVLNLEKRHTSFLNMEEVGAGQHGNVYIIYGNINLTA